MLYSPVIYSRRSEPAISDKKLKILQVLPYFFPAWAYGGIPRVVYELSRELTRMGHDVTVYTTDALDQDKRCDQSGRETKVDGITVRYFRNISNSLAYHYQIFLPLGMRRVVQETIDGFDVIHLHGHRNFLNNIVHYYAKKVSNRYILSGHGTVLRIERRIFAKLIFDRIFGDRVLRDAGRFVAVSEYEVRQYAEMGIEQDKVDVIYNGIDIEAFTDLPEAGAFRKKYGLMGNKLVLYLGRITPRKGIDFLVKAFSMLDASDASLVIAGNDMGFKREVDTIARGKGVSARIIFTGLLTGRDKLSAYRDADVLVHPAIHEIFGLVPFEAMMCGTPVIVADNCGCGEIIGNEGIGYLVKYNDLEGLRDRITEVLACTPDAHERSKRGRAFIANNLTWNSIGNKYAALYQEMVNNNLHR
jgi:glycosyltransferase involved in cell wall biosynthesis